jgi:hypothetical protein
MPTAAKAALPAFTMVTRKRGQRARPDSPSQPATSTRADTPSPEPREPRETTSATPTPTPSQRIIPGSPTWPGSPTTARRTRPVAPVPGLAPGPAPFPFPLRPTGPEPSDRANAPSVPAGLADAVANEAKKATGFLDCLQEVAARLEEILSPLQDQFPTQAGSLLKDLTTVLRKHSRPERAPGALPTSYAQTARQGTQRPAAPGPNQTIRPNQIQAKTKPPPASLPDARIMVRLPADHPLRKAGPYAVRQRAEALPETKGLFKDAAAVRSGFALIPRRPLPQAIPPEALTALQKHLEASIVEPQEDWTTFLLEGIPRRVYSLGTTGPEDLAVSPEMISEEVYLQTNLRPRRALWTRQSQQDNSPVEGTAILHFPSSALKGARIPYRLRVFGLAAILRPLKKTRKAPNCEKCAGTHSTEKCTRQPKCLQCGQQRHGASCDKPPRCLNCRGPHRSGAPDCPARPVVKNGVWSLPNRAQRSAIRAAGSRAWRETFGEALQPTKPPQLAQLTQTSQASTTNDR